MRKSLAEQWQEHFKRLEQPTERSERPYAPNWSIISSEICNATKVCCWCFVRRAVLTHHWRYRDRRGKIYGREKGGKHGAGVCRRCHGWLHRKAVWHKAIDPDDDRNILSVALLLRFNYHFLSIVTKHWWLITLIAIALFFK